MPRYIKNRLKSKGKAPGSLILIGEQKMKESRIRVVEYDPEQLVEKECSHVEEALASLKSPSVTWLNIDGLHDTTLMEKTGKELDLHPLILEDIMTTDHPPKFEEEDEMIIVMLKFILPAQEGKLASEQVTIILGPRFVLTFQEQTGLHFEAVRERIRKNRGRIRTGGADYLAYALLDAISDSYTEIIGNMGEKVEDLEEEVLWHHSSETAGKLLHLKSEMSFLKKIILPVREISEKLNKTDSELIREETRKFLADFNEHVAFAKETVDTYLSMVNDHMNSYHNSISNRANEIMKTLTLFASVFIPLTFIAGIYGMNFRIIPELTWKWGYLFFWIMTILVAGSIILFFGRKKWL